MVELMQKIGKDFSTDDDLFIILTDLRVLKTLASVPYIK